MPPPFRLPHMKTEHFKRYVAVLEEQGSLKLEKFDFPA